MREPFVVRFQLQAGLGERNTTGMRPLFDSPELGRLDDRAGRRANDYEVEVVDDVVDFTVPDVSV